MKKQYIAFILALIVVLFIGRECGHADKPTTNTEADSLKALVVDLIIQRDSAKAKVDTITLTQTKVLTRWKTIRQVDSIPCEEKLLVCDTIIKVDNSLIRELKTVVKLDSSIISNQGLTILSQDEQITDLEKQVKKERRKKRFWQVLTAVSIGAALTNR